MAYDDVITRNENEELAVRTVNSSGDNYVNKDDIYTRDNDGKLCIRTVGNGGGGGGDTHNKGYYATPEDLQEAIPEAEAGDYAIVGSTDTVWVWDTTTSAWVDTDTKGEVSPDMVIIKSLNMPTASTTPEGAVYQYIGTTNASYTHGYIYENVRSIIYTGTVSFEPATLSATTVACSGDNFANFLTESGVSPLSVVSGTMTYDATGSLWVLVGKNSNNETVLSFQEYQEDYEDAGFTFTGTPQDGDVISFTCTVEEGSVSYVWTRIDVQPAPVIPDPLPDQTGNAGKFLTTDGSQTSWGTALANQTTASHSLVVGEEAVEMTGSYNIAIGYKVNGGSSSSDNIAIGAFSQAVNSSIAVGRSSLAKGVDSTAIGYNAQANGSYSISVGDRATANGTSITIGRSSQSEDRCLSLGVYTYSRYDSIGIGYGSSTSTRTKADYYSIAIGNNAKAENNCIAIGNYQVAGAYSICIGTAANGFSTSSNVVAICAGEQGWSTSGTIPQGCIVLSAVNRTSTTFFNGLTQNSMYVGLGSTLWKILDGTTGLFNPNRIASTTGLADGTYVLKMTIVDGTPTLSWVLES